MGKINLNSDRGSGAEVETADVTKTGAETCGVVGDRK